jgi:uncharacterized protein (DUF3084 family)
MDAYLSFLNQQKLEAEQTAKIIEEKTLQKKILEEEISQKTKDHQNLKQQCDQLEEKMKNLNENIQEREKEIIQRENFIKKIEDSIEVSFGEKSEIIQLNVGGKLFISTYGNYTDGIMNGKMNGG